MLEVNDQYPGRLGILQRVLPHYRVPFFERLSGLCAKGVCVSAGDPHHKENIRHAPELLEATDCHYTGNRHLFVGGQYFCWQHRLMDWLKAYEPDALVVEANPRILSTLAAIRWMKTRRRPVVGWGLGMLPWQGARSVVHSGRMKLLRWFYGQFDAVIAYSSKAAMDYQDAGVNPRKVYVAKNAVSTDHVGPFMVKLERQPELLSTWRRRLGLQEGRLTIVYVGKLEKAKCVDRLIAACEPWGRRLQLLVVGPGPEREALDSQARAANVPAVFTGPQYGEDLAFCFAGADIFVLPGLGGLAVQEAMSYGLPVVVGAADGTQADLVQSEKNGFMVENGNTLQIRAAIRQFIDQPELIKRFGKVSLQITKTDVNLDRMAEVFVSAVGAATPILQET